MLTAIRKGMRFRLTLGLTIATFTGICLIVGTAEVRDFGVFSGIGVQPAAAQFSIPQDAWRRVYEQLPNLPLENQYVSKETGKIDENNTLISRFMRYHIFVKRRPSIYRLDWKLSLADYLGAHNYLVESQYPSGDTLRENPMESDRKAMEKLTRAERDALVNVLVSLFNPNSTQQSAPSPRETPTPTPPPPTSDTPTTTPSLPKPGDAQLLMP